MERKIYQEIDKNSLIQSEQKTMNVFEFLIIIFFFVDWMKAVTIFFVKTADIAAAAAADDGFNLCKKQSFT